MVYDRDGDLSKIGFREYTDHPNRSYPTITFCFSREAVYPKGDYANFKDGLNPTMNPTTITVSDFLDAFGYSSSTGWKWWFGEVEGQFGLWGAKNLPFKNFSHVYVSYQDFRTKCFSLDLAKLIGGKNGVLNAILLAIKPTMFPERTMQHPNFGIYYHYPNQLLRGLRTKLMRRVHKPLTKKSYNLVTIKGIEVVVSRHTADYPCIENMENWDATILENWIAYVGHSSEN